MLDYIIVGSGLAGIAFSETLLQNQKSFVVFENQSQNSSRVAGGLYNPVILKRFSQVWDAERQLALANQFYAQIEAKLQVQVDFKMPIYRKFFSIEEQNNWFAASDKPSLSPFLSTTIVHKKFNAIDSAFGYGEVLHTGYLETDVFLNTYQAYLKAIDILVPDAFRYEKLQMTDEMLTYENFQAKHIVFAEGFGMHANPYFKNLPLDGTKGELFIIKAPDLNLDVIINTSIFILPLGDNLFKVGATYNWEDKTDLPTEEGKTQLVERIREILQCEFEIVSHFAGVRPTVNDRRPLLGTHPSHKNMHILNGLGTRGVMLAPAMASDLFNYIENQKPLDKSIDIQRYITSF
jgi:glycine/D-amino acid oxidase-like deaminating enzyme